VKYPRRQLPGVNVDFQAGMAFALAAGALRDCDAFAEILPVLNPVQMHPQIRELIMLEVPFLHQRMQRLDHVLCGSCRDAALKMVDLQNHKFSAGKTT
jgi:hypothetical protein